MNLIDIIIADMTLVRRAEDFRLFFLFQILKIKLVFAFLPRKWFIWAGGEERDGSDAKTQMSDVEKTVFCSVLFNF